MLIKSMDNNNFDQHSHISAYEFSAHSLLNGGAHPEMAETLSRSQLNQSQQFLLLDEEDISRDLQSCGSASSSDGHSETKQPSAARYGRPWAEVNQSVSSKMVASASDSPPIIPKRDYDHTPTPTRPRKRATPEAAASIAEESEASAHHRVAAQAQQHHAMTMRSMSNGSAPRDIYGHAGAMVLYQAGPPVLEPFQPGFFPDAIPSGYPPHPMLMTPRPLFPPLPPPPVLGAGMAEFDPMLLHAPPPGALFCGAPGPVPLPGPDPGILFTPYGPVHPTEFADADAAPTVNRKQKRKQKYSKRSRSLDQLVLTPPFMARPPPHFVPFHHPMEGASHPPMFAPPPHLLNGGQLPPPGALVPFIPRHKLPEQLPHFHQSQPPPVQGTTNQNAPESTLQNGRTTSDAQQKHNGSSRHVAQSPTAAEGGVAGYDYADGATISALSKKNQMNEEHGSCYLMCCQGFTQVVWIIVAVILIGLILGLVLGLTLV